MEVPVLLPTVYVLLILEVAASPAVAAGLSGVRAVASPAAGAAAGAALVSTAGAAGATADTAVARGFAVPTAGTPVAVAGLAGIPEINPPAGGGTGIEAVPRTEVEIADWLAAGATGLVVAAPVTGALTLLRLLAIEEL
jgi:hypothetical protein